MPEPLELRARRYLDQHGWTRSDEASTPGTMWIRPGHNRGVPVKVVIPPRMTQGSQAWAWLIRNLAEQESRDPAVITAEILGCRPTRRPS
ncbi:MAG: hypothetical protein ACRDOL_31875 [Streptosporangiaceae bacterium]